MQKPRAVRVAKKAQKLRWRRILQPTSGPAAGLAAGNSAMSPAPTARAAAVAGTAAAGAAAGAAASPSPAAVAAVKRSIHPDAGPGEAASKGPAEADLFELLQAAACEAEAALAAAGQEEKEPVPAGPPALTVQLAAAYSAYVDTLPAAEQAKKVWEAEAGLCCPTWGPLGLAVRHAGKVSSRLPCELTSALL